MGSKSDIRVKEESKDDIVIVNEKKPDIRNDILPKIEGRNDSLPPHSYPGMMPVNSMMDRRYMGMYPGMERPQGLWNPLGLDMNHRVDLQRSAMEREKQELLRMQYLELDRLREHELLMREREFNKIPPPLRPADPFVPGGPINSMYLPRTGSPLVNHNTSKSNSPSSTVGAPPPLIPSNNTHSNSPTGIKVKPSSSPVQLNTSPDSTSKDKREPSANGHDTEASTR